MVRDAFDLAKEKIKNEGRKGTASRLVHLLNLLTPGAIIFIDELDAIGTKRYGGEQSGDREVQRTMLELLNQLDGFSSSDKIKVIAATNRPGNSTASLDVRRYGADTLDPALLRSGRLDRKVELPHPAEKVNIG